MPKVMKGVDVTKSIKEEIIKDVESLKARDITPLLATIRVGEKPDAISYERGIIRNMENLGIECKNVVLDEDIQEDEFLNKVKEINDSPEVHGILILRPLPDRLESEELDYLVEPIKDLDGGNPINMGKLMFNDETAHVPCTAEACIRVLEHFNIETQGKEAVVIGRSLVVGKPLSMLLLNKNATVTICHSRTKDIEKVCKRADIVIAAVGVPNFVTKDFVKEGAVVIDVGINVDEEGKLVGDVKFDEVEPIASKITPVPRGVGSVTNTLLAEHLIKACKYLNK